MLTSITLSQQKSINSHENCQFSSLLRCKVGRRDKNKWCILVLQLRRGNGVTTRSLNGSHNIRFH